MADQTRVANRYKRIPAPSLPDSCLSQAPVSRDVAENAEILAIQFVPAFAKRCIFSMGIDLRSTTKRSNHYSPLLGGSFRVRVSNFELGKLMRLHVVAIAKSGHVIDFIHSGKQSSVEVCCALNVSGYPQVRGMCLRNNHLQQVRPQSPPTEVLGVIFSLLVFFRVE